MINEDIRHIIETELREGETLLWFGTPQKPPRTIGQTFQFIFSCIWLGMVLIIFFPVGLNVLYSEESGGFGLFFFLFISLFICVGVGMVILTYRSLKASEFEIYAITDQRGVILSTYGKRKVMSLSPQELLSIERVSGSNSLSTIKFGAGISSLFQLHALMFGEKIQASFKNIADAKSIETLIYKTFQNKGTTP